MITVDDQWAWVLLWLAVGAIWLYFTGPYRRYRIDLLRDRLFQVRDELFDQAIAAKERGVEDPFGEDAYGITRLTINGMIHFAHEVSITDIFSSWLSYQNMTEAERDVMTRVSEVRDTALESLEDEEFRLAIEKALLNTNIHIVGHVLNTSLVLAFIWHPLKWAAMLLEPLVGRIQAIRARWQEFELELHTQANSLEAIQFLDAEAELYAANSRPVPVKAT